MGIQAVLAPPEQVAPFRELYRHEMGCQIVSDSYLRRGFSDAYLLSDGSNVAGYGLVTCRDDPGMLHEYHVFPAYRSESLPLFRQLLEVSRASRVRAQTNDRDLLLRLLDCCTKTHAEAVLFEDAYTTRLELGAGLLRRTTEDDRKTIFEHRSEPVGEWMVEQDGVAVATGGALHHYNPPYADLYMEVEESHRRQGLGSYLIQELKKMCYEGGKVPAARCDAGNTASRRTLQKAGMLPCARILVGEVDR
ncbi:MAG TPA: GNAT family N-acetyltransferase [Armatimonadota bacterium]|jgi:GNAT superfamily N-acetyltransferase